MFEPSCRMRARWTFTLHMDMSEPSCRTRARCWRRVYSSCQCYRWTRRRIWLASAWAATDSVRTCGRLVWSIIHSSDSTLLRHLDPLSSLSSPNSDTGTMSVAQLLIKIAVQTTCWCRHYCDRKRVPFLLGALSHYNIVEFIGTWFKNCSCSVICKRGTEVLCYRLRWLIDWLIDSVDRLLSQSINQCWWFSDWWLINWFTDFYSSRATFLT